MFLFPFSNKTNANLKFKSVSLLFRCSSLGYFVLTAKNCSNFKFYDKLLVRNQKYLQSTHLYIKIIVQGLTFILQNVCHFQIHTVLIDSREANSPHNTDVYARPHSEARLARED